MNTFEPMTTVLDIWARSMSCPICRNTGLEVIREPGVSDILHCERCDCEFVFEQGATHIRFSQVPEVLGDSLIGEWLTYSEVHKRIHGLIQELRQFHPDLVGADTVPLARRNGSVKLHPKAEPEGLAPSSEKLIEQAQELFRLGNSISEIKRILARNPRNSSQDIKIALDSVSQVQHGNRLRSWLFVSLASIAVLVVFGVIIASGVVPTLLSNLKSVVNNTASELIPVTGSQPAGASNASCPANAAAAASVFGGNSDRWTYEKPNWYYQDIKTVDLYIPDGMEASYPQIGDKFTIDRVKGPVILRNVMTASITC